MPAYNFKDQFVELVRSGRKRTTIRQVRKKRPTRLGDRLFLFNRMRTNKCRLIKDTECIGLTPITILTGQCPAVVLDGTRFLTAKQVEALACRDGFPSSAEFFAFFAKTYGPHFSGELIEWPDGADNPGQTPEGRSPGSCL